MLRKFREELIQKNTNKKRYPKDGAENVRGNSMRIFLENSMSKCWRLSKIYTVPVCVHWISVISPGMESDWAPCDAALTGAPAIGELSVPGGQACPADKEEGAKHRFPSTGRDWWDYIHAAHPLLFDFRPNARRLTPSSWALTSSAFLGSRLVLLPQWGICWKRAAVPELEDLQWFRDNNAFKQYLFVITKINIFTFKSKIIG